MSLSNSSGIIYDIEDGPTKDELMEAFKEFKGEENRLFKVSLKYGKQSGTISLLTKGFKIVMIEYTNGSNHKFNLEGYCEACLTRTKDTAEEIEVTGHHFTATYDTEKRTGKMHFG